jgi:predicted ester cyclase
MSTYQSDNKAIVKRLHEAMNTNDMEFLAETIGEIVDPEVLIRTPVSTDATGRQALMELLGRVHRAFPDLHITIEDLIAEGDEDVARNSITGTHRGEYMGLAPTGKRVMYDEIFIFHFAGGRVMEIWGVVDIFAQLRQLGMVSA